MILKANLVLIEIVRYFFFSKYICHAEIVLKTQFYFCAI